MKHIIDHLSERESYLRNLQKEKEKELRHAPEGTLRVDNRKRERYFIIENHQNIQMESTFARNIEIWR